MGHRMHHVTTRLGIQSEPATPPPEHVDPVITARPTTTQTRDPSILFERLQLHSRRRHGVRKTRRLDNARLLQTLAEEDVESWREPNIHDFRPDNDAPFTRLHKDVEDMRVWKYFASRSEEEQQQYLECIARQKLTKSGGAHFTNRVSYPEEMENYARIGKVKNSGEQREREPYFHTPLWRFSQVTPNLRRVLKRKHLPLGLLSKLEDDIVELFHQDSSAVYISGEMNSFERLLLHAACQYNLLHSHSIDIAGNRRAKVENRTDNFSVPELSLTQYIETCFRQH
ncbi:R3H domain-containing protein 4-like isoform X2 [Oratosquilla oratoria]|uniref:R3H domain-containing protein 4-like isoform X2 n=1 Tax=Oratosquilla oratoria TaxID=337810 RepID=UPI003F76B7F3